jgi:hypothetical protein
VFDTTGHLPFQILDGTSKSFPKFKATGRSMLIKFNSPGEEPDPAEYLKEFITSLTDYLVGIWWDSESVTLRM